MRLRRDERGQAIGIARFFLSLGVGAIMIWILTELGTPLFARANESTDPTANQTTIWLQQGVDFLPIVFLLVSFFGLIAYSVYAREVLG